MRSLLMVAIALATCGCGSAREERNYQAIANEVGPKGCAPDDRTCLMENDKNTVID